MDEQADEWKYTADPQTILKLPAEHRAEAVADIFHQASVAFLEAVVRDDAKSAQQNAISAIAVIGGLFPDRDAPAYHFINFVIGAFLAARSGSRDHILLRPGARVPGTRSGFGKAAVAGGAVAAVTVLCEHGMSRLAARKLVAKLLSENGMSLRKGEHGEPKPVTASAVRAWEERIDDNPIASATAPQFAATLREAIAKDDLRTLEQVVNLIVEQAAIFVPKTLAY